MVELFLQTDGRRVGDGHLRGAGVCGVPSAVSVPMADIRHLAAAKDGTVNPGTTADADDGIGHTSQVVFQEFLRIASSTAIDVAKVIVAHQQVKAFVNVVADEASTDLNLGQAVTERIVNIRVIDEGIETAINTHAGECNHAAAVEVAQNGTARHGDVGVAAHTTASEVGMRRDCRVLALGWNFGIGVIICFVALTAAKHMAVVAREARAADDGGVVIIGLADGHRSAVQDMTHLGTAEHGAVDDAARDLHIGGIHHGLVVEKASRVACTAAEDVGGGGLRLNLFHGAWHTDGAAAHPDGGLTATLGVHFTYLHSVGLVVVSICNAIVAHVGRLVGTIHVVEDVAAGDDHLGVAPYPTRVRVPAGLD